MKNQIAMRDLVSVFANAAAVGASNPEYTREIAKEIPAEILQVSGGESVRGKSVEAITAFVVSIRELPGVQITAECKVDVLSGPYKGQSIFIHRVHFENWHGRPVRVQLHCKAKS